MGIDALRIGAIPTNSVFSSSSSFNLSASTSKVGWVFTARESATITHLGFVLQSRTGTAPNYQISLQSVDADGNPSGTILGATSNALKIFDPATLATGDLSYLALDESADLSVGQKYAIAIEYSSGTINGSNLATVRYQTSGLSTSYDTTYAYALTNAGSWSKNTTGVSIYAYRSSTKRYGLTFTTTRSTITFSSATNPNEVGLKFAIPAPFTGAATYKLRGLDLMMTATGSDSWSVQLYSGGGASDTTPIDSVTNDNDCFQSAIATTRKQIFFDGTPPTLNFGDTYRLSFTPSDSSSQNIYTLPLTAADDVQALMLGDTFCYTTRNGGNWTDNTLAVPMVFELFIEDITYSAGGGGSFLTPSIQGLTGVRSY